MIRGLALAVDTLRAVFFSRADLMLENLALRQQLATFVSHGRRPRVVVTDRMFWIVLRRFWSRWSEVLVFVKPETVVRWHRASFRRYWTWLSRRPPRGRPQIDAHLRGLILQMALENPSWGAPRIHGELRMLGFEVSERTVSRCLPRRRPPPGAFNRWLIFLRNHRGAIAAMDFFIVPTATFRLLYAWFAIEHGLRRILHFEVTEHPTAAWVIQQLREAFPYDSALHHLVFDRDAIFSPRVISTVQSLGIRPARTAYRSPWQNGVAERWVGSVRREFLNHLIVINERHLRQLLRQYIAYYQDDRTHLALAKETPAGRRSPARRQAGAGVVALPRLGGLHHRYDIAA